MHSKNLTELLVVIETYANARGEVVNARWGLWEGTGDQEAVGIAERAEKRAEKKMTKALRELADPRT